MQKGNRRIYFIKIAVVGGITLLLILGIGALRVTTPNPDIDSAFASVISRLISKSPPDHPNPASKKRDYLKKSDWPQGLCIYRDWWKERDAAVYVAEMRRESRNLRFGVELANNRLLGKETISSMAGRLAQQDVSLLAGVNGSFGLRGDRVGRKLDNKLQYYLQQVIQVIVNSYQLSLDTVLAEWSAQLGKEATTFKRILADLRERGVGGARGR